MKKIICFLLLMFFIGETSGKNNDITELSDSVRELTGRVEQLEKIVVDLQKKAEELENKNSQEEKTQKDMEEISQKTPEEILKMACDYLEENNMEKCRRVLNAFVTKNPTNIYCGIMLFYIGNSHFIEKNYKNAALAYMKGFKANPSGSKAAETLYKLALCFKQLGEEEKCKSTLEKIISDYKGEFARKASIELKKRK
ncbi:MAG: tetratricopeptide repeat protein [Holosporaceae bacterium]|jgi:TolA-binding protein|nr:tetratricopeptide repeat protein [Holosporaceae bacterium]